MKKIILVIILLLQAPLPYLLSEETLINIYNSQKDLTESVSKIQKTNKEWKKILSPHAYHITREAGTERAYTGKYDHFKGKGIYQCVACLTDLFSSKSKYDSHTGWPSFTEPIAKDNIAQQKDNSLNMKRTEIMCARCDAHLGHVFDDGPAPTHMHYCINSAAMLFKAAQN